MQIAYCLRLSQLNYTSSWLMQGSNNNPQLATGAFSASLATSRSDAGSDSDPTQRLESD